jgi:hypothetical protein
LNGQAGVRAKEERRRCGDVRRGHGGALPEAVHELGEVGRPTDTRELKRLLEHAVSVPIAVEISRGVAAGSNHI